MFENGEQIVVYEWRTIATIKTVGQFGEVLGIRVSDDDEQRVAATAAAAAADGYTKNRIK